MLKQLIDIDLFIQVKALRKIWMLSVLHRLKLCSVFRSLRSGTNWMLFPITLVKFSHAFLLFEIPYHSIVFDLFLECSRMILNVKHMIDLCFCLYTLAIPKCFETKIENFWCTGTLKICITRYMTNTRFFVCIEKKSVAYGKYSTVPFGIVISSQMLI